MTERNPMTLRPTLALAAVLLLAGAAHAQQAQVGITIDGPPLPGLFGRVQIGANLPLPPVYLPRPVVVAPPPVAVVAPREPLYLWVPPGHRKDWKRHCGAYDACGRPVYFVQERWVREHEPHRFEKKRGRGHDDDHPGRGRGRGKDDDHKGKSKGKDKD